MVNQSMVFAEKLVDMMSVGKIFCVITHKTLHESGMKEMGSFQRKNVWIMGYKKIEIL